MRELNECTAEVFRRSEKRIKERKKSRNRALALCIPLCLIVTVCSAMILPAMMSAKSDKASDAEMFAECNTSDDGRKDYTCAAAPEELGSLDSFSFSMTWGNFCNAGSYDSRTGELIKTKSATNPEDYVTTYLLTAEQKQRIYDLISDLNVTSYPDTYNPHSEGAVSRPPRTLILSVNTDTVHKTVAAKSMAGIADNRMGEKFLSVCSEIEDILTSTEEWKSLPEYEFNID